MIKKSIYRFMYANSNFSTKALILCFALSCMFTQNILGQSFLWAKAINGNIVSSSVATDVVGNIYVAGVFAGPTITFGGTTLINTGVNTMFLAKFDQSGNCHWAKCANGLGYHGKAAVTTDHLNNVYVSGSFDSGILDFGVNAISGTKRSNMFIAQYNTNGYINWINTADGYTESIYAAPDSFGNVILAGRFQDILNIDYFTLDNGAFNFPGIFAVKYNHYGVCLWAKELMSGNNTDDDVFCIVAHIGGSFYLANSINGHNQIAKFDYNGNWVGGSAWGTPVSAMCIDPFGNLYSSQTNTINKYNINDTLIHTFNLVDSGYCITTGLATDSVGNLYISGWFSQPDIKFGGTTITNNGVNDMFLAKYGPDTNFIWVKHYGGTNDDKATSVATFGNNVYMTGDFKSPSITIDTDNFTTTGYDMVLVMYGDSTLATVDLHENQTLLRVYPNPASSFINVDFGKSGIEGLSITNCIGVPMELNFVKTGFNTIKINVGSFPNGLYYITTISKLKNSTEQFIVQH